MATQPLAPNEHRTQQGQNSLTSTIIRFPGASSRNIYNLIASVSDIDISDATQPEIEAFFLEHQTLWPELMVSASKDMQG